MGLLLNVSDCFSRGHTPRVDGLKELTIHASTTRPLYSPDSRKSTLGDFVHSRALVARRNVYRVSRFSDGQSATHSCPRQHNFHLTSRVCMCVCGLPLNRWQRILSVWNCIYRPCSVRPRNTKNSSPIICTS